ncbi:hypothetical protein MesoLj113c_29990 [Mesorhizobium sp. 113-3-9]|uniref:GTPase-associated system all-helical protein GASH n=1 Tax=Mesorhizobium sp. 113-3-9 TaxID=2744517 RepID=UPI00192888EF|nr:GTPase-associated system all-helical protein GASH [Mesorhizobium sp. 113-3-9]BCG86889.1 hypothetical protein MesoLj113c_29990 [Mesorhizobium sp. 113-3-9]
MSNMAEYARIFDTATGDDWVEKRKLAVTDAKRWMGELSTSQAIKIASGIAAAVAGSALPSEIVAAGEQKIQNHASSFVVSADEGELQIKVVLMAAAIDVVSHRPAAEGGWGSADALAASFWSALWFQAPLDQPKIERLRQDLLSASRERVLQVASDARRRRAVPKIGPVNIAQDSVAGTKVNTAFTRAIEPMVSVMRENAALDREELDFMWWVLSDRSDSLDEPFAAMPEATRAVVAGFDASAKLRKLPADAHKNIVLRNIVSEEKLALLELVKQLGDRRAALVEHLQTPLVAEAPAVFPLIDAITTGSSKVPFAAEKLAPSEWGARALLEGAIRHLQVGTVGTL